MGQTNRGLLNHGAGKGDADRTENVEAFKKNYEGIDFTKELPTDTTSEVLVNTPKRFIKRYGAAKEPEPIVGLPKIVIH
jgi:hypothetical protein